MIIDSHAQYNNNCYKKPFRHLNRNKDGYALEAGEREQLIQKLLDAFAKTSDVIAIGETDAPFILP